MEENVVQNKDEFLLRIARHLIMHASFLIDLGLYHGKMGIVLFFAHYARYTGKPIYDEFAGELLDEIFEKLHTNMPFNFETGLCGIGWGIEYLIQNGFVEGDANEILSEIDQKIMEWDLLRITDKSVQTGVEGIIYYIEMRVDNKEHIQKVFPFDAEYLSDLDAIKKNRPTPCMNHILNTICEERLLYGDITKWELGIYNGCAGYGLKQMLL